MKLLVKILLFIAALSANYYAAAQTSKLVAEGVHSEYKNGEFITSIAIEVNAPYNVVENVFNEIYEGMKNAPTKDLKWAFHGLGGKKNASEDMTIRENGVEYNTKNHSYALKLLVGLAGQDASEYTINGILKNTTTKTGTKEVEFRVTEKIKILNSCGVKLQLMKKSKDRSVIHLHSNIGFAWLFNLFFTKKRYQNIMEWRLNGFLNNIKLRSEEQYNTIKSIKTF